MLLINRVKRICGKRAARLNHAASSRTALTDVDAAVPDVMANRLEYLGNMPKSDLSGPPSRPEIRRV